MSRVSERVLDASPPVEDDREVRSLIVAALERLRNGRSDDREITHAPNLGREFE